MKRFKRLDLVNSVLEELWTEICTGGGEQNYPKRKRKEKAMWLLEVALQSGRRKRSEKQRRERKLYPIKPRVPKNN